MRRLGNFLWNTHLLILARWECLPWSLTCVTQSQSTSDMDLSSDQFKLFACGPSLLYYFCPFTLIISIKGGDSFRYSYQSHTCIRYLRDRERLSLQYVFFFFVYFFLEHQGSYVDASYVIGLGYALRREGKIGFWRNPRGTMGILVLVVPVREEDQVLYHWKPQYLLECLMWRR